MGERLKGKVAIITGGNSGIGESTGRLFAQEGARVVLMARREEQGQIVANSICDGGGEAVFVSCDVGDHELTRYMPVKVKTGSNWDVDGTGKLFVFCAEDLRQWVTTKVPNYERYYDTNPMTSNVISGVQYLTQEEITAEEAKYTDLKSEDKDVEENRKKLEREANEKGFAEAKKFLRDNSMLSILRKQRKRESQSSRGCPKIASSAIASTCWWRCRSIFRCLAWGGASKISHHRRTMWDV